jgi:hypothetical protein
MEGWPFSTEFAERVRTDVLEPFSSFAIVVGIVDIAALTVPVSFGCSANRRLASQAVDLVSKRHHIVAGVLWLYQNGDLLTNTLGVS